MEEDEDERTVASTENSFRGPPRAVLIGFPVSDDEGDETPAGRQQHLLALAKTELIYEEEGDQGSQYGGHPTRPGSRNGYSASVGSNNTGSYFVGSGDSGGVGRGYLVGGRDSVYLAARPAHSNRDYTSFRVEDNISHDESTIDYPTNGDDAVSLSTPSSLIPYSSSHLESPAMLLSGNGRSSSTEMADHMEDDDDYRGGRGSSV